MEYLFLLLFALLHIKINSQELNIYGEQKHNYSAEISCFFQKKDSRPVYWHLGDTEMTRGCTIQPGGNGILTESDYCDDEILGPANYSFIINQLDIDRDLGTVWSCGYEGIPNKLNITFGGHKATTEMVKTSSKSTGYVRGEEISLTTEMECAYPQTDIIWCFGENDNDGSKLCSDVNDYWEGSFTESPVITQESFSCEESYGTATIKSHRSTFTATAVAKSRRTSVTFSIIASGLLITKFDGTTTILSFCLIKAGCLAIWVIVLIVISTVAAIVGASIVGVYLYNKNSKKNKHIHGEMPNDFPNTPPLSKSKEKPTGDQPEVGNSVKLKEIPPGKERPLPQKSNIYN